MNIILKKAQRWLLRFVQVQLFITAVSFPILLSWGLPVSIVSPIGNLLFFPFLAVFLLLSSVIFFLEILYIPNQWLIFILEYVSSWWTYAMSFGSSSYFLVGFAQPSIWFLLAIPLLAFAIIHNNKTNSINRSTALFALLLIVSFGYLKLISSHKTCFETLECNGGKVTLIKKNKITVIIDPGVIGKRISAPTWIEYTLAPHLIKITGSRCIDHIVALQPGIMTFKALEKLCTTMRVKTIHLPYWDGTLTKSGWRSFFFLKRAAQKQGTTIARIGRYKKTITLSDKDYINIEPLKHSLAYQDATYPALKIIGQIDKQPFTLYAAKYEKIAQKQKKTCKKKEAKWRKTLCLLWQVMDTNRLNTQSQKEF